MRTNGTDGEDPPANIDEHPCDLIISTPHVIPVAQQHPNDNDANKRRDISVELSEKERDLELAAKIGSSLLEQNTELQERNAFLEEALSASNDTVSELQRQLKDRASFFSAFVEVDNQGVTSARSEAGRVTHSASLESRQLSCSPRECGDDGKCGSPRTEQLVRRLERENRFLRTETTRLEEYMTEMEQREQIRLDDYIRRLEKANSKITHLQAQLVERSQECVAQKEQLEKLIVEIDERGRIEKALTCESEDLRDQLRRAGDAQQGMRAELATCRERYLDVLSVLHDAEDELRGCRQNAIAMPPCRSASSDSLYYSSLASELEATADSGFYNTPMLLSARCEGADPPAASPQPHAYDVANGHPSSSIDVPSQALLNAIREGSSSIGHPPCYSNSSNGGVGDGGSIADESNRECPEEWNRDSVKHSAPDEPTGRNASENSPQSEDDTMLANDTPMSYSTISFRSALSVRTVVPAHEERRRSCLRPEEERVPSTLQNQCLNASCSFAPLDERQLCENKSARTTASALRSLCALWMPYGEPASLSPQSEADALDTTPYPSTAAAKGSSKNSPRLNGIDTRELGSSSSDSLNSYNGPKMGEPGRPGTRDLDWSIKRLRLRRQIEKDYEEFRRRRRALGLPFTDAAASTSAVAATDHRISNLSAATAMHYSTRQFPVLPGRASAHASYPITRLLSTLRGTTPLFNFAAPISTSMFSGESHTGVIRRAAINGSLQTPAVKHEPSREASPNSPPINGVIDSSAIRNPQCLTVVKRPTKNFPFTSSSLTNPLAQLSSPGGIVQRPDALSKHP